MNTQTVTQICRCWSLGGYRATVVDGELRVQGPQPLAGPLPDSIRARREELIEALTEFCGGTWPPAPGSPAHSRERRFLRILEDHYREEAA